MVESSISPPGRTSARAGLQERRRVGHVLHHLQAQHGIERLRPPPPAPPPAPPGSRWRGPGPAACRRAASMFSVRRVDARHVAPRAGPAARRRGRRRSRCRASAAPRAAAAPPSRRAKVPHQWHRAGTSSAPARSGAACGIAVGVPPLATPAARSGPARRVERGRLCALAPCSCGHWRVRGTFLSRPCRSTADALRSPGLVAKSTRGSGLATAATLARPPSRRSGELGAGGRTPGGLSCLSWS